MLSKLTFAAVLLLGMLLSAERVAEVESVVIGEQEWMARNLNADHFRNGDKVPHITNAKDWFKAYEQRQPAYCYYGFNAANGKKYGKLYNWFAVTDPRGLAPEGWRMPSLSDWQEMIDFLGEDEAGKKVKSISGWKNDKNGTNETGFNALPAGGCSNGADFLGMGSYAYWWCTDEKGAYQARIVDISIYHPADKIKPYIMYKGSGKSVRCIKE